MSIVSGKTDLTEGPVARHVVRMSVPMLWGILSMISVQLVDTFYIGLLGTAPLAAIGFTFPVTMTVLSLIIGLGIAMSSVLSRKSGAKQHDDIVPITSHGILLALGAGTLMGATGLVVMKPLFTAMGAEGPVLTLVLDYMQIWFAGCIVMALPLVGNSAMRALGDTITPAFIMMGLSLLNAVLAALLVFGLLGFPRMGMQGAALATVLSFAAAACASLCVLYFKKKMIFQGSLHMERFGSSVRALLHVALPVGAASIIQPVAQGIITVILAAHGAAAVAAFGVATRVEAMAFVIIIALATGMSPIIGQNWGAARRDRVRETLRLAMLFAVLWSLAIAVLLALFARPVAAAFSTNPDVIHNTILYFLIVPFSYAPWTLLQGWSSAFNAIGESKKALVMIVVRSLVLQVPLALFFGRLFGVTGVFWAIAVTNVVTGLFFHFRHWPDLAYDPPEMRSAA